MVHNEALLPLISSDQNVGTWKLPISSDHPEQVTEAQVRLVLRQDSPGKAWKAHLQFSFPDPKPYGIPFSFQTVEVRWNSWVGTGVAELDWSEECTSPGRSMFPGQSWDAELDLSGTEGSPALEGFSFKLWGSRN